MFLPDGAYAFLKSQGKRTTTRKREWWGAQATGSSKKTLLIFHPSDLFLLLCDTVIEEYISWSALHLNWQNADTSKYYKSHSHEPVLNNVAFWGMHNRWADHCVNVVDCSCTNLHGVQISHSMWSLYRIKIQVNTRYTKLLPLSHATCCMAIIFL